MRAFPIVLSCIVVFGLLCATPHAASLHSSSSDGQVAEAPDSEFLISGILEKLLRPLKELLAAQVRSIIASIRDQGGHIAGRLAEQIDRLAEMIRPFVIRMLDRLNDIIGAGVDLRERVQITVQRLFEYLGVINDANKEIIGKLIDYITEKLLGGLRPLQLAEDSPLFLGKINNWLVRPILELMRRQAKAIILSLLDQVGHVTEKLLDHVDVIAELIRPSVIRILDVTGNLHAEAIHFRETVKGVVTQILGNLGAIGEEGQHIVQQLIEKVTDIIVGSLRPGNKVATAPKSFLIIRRIIRRIMRPIVNRLNSILDRIRQLAKDKTDEAKAKLLKLYDELTLLLREPVIRIIGVLNDIGVDIGDTAEAVKRTIEIIIDSVRGIRNENKKMLKAIMAGIVQRLLEFLPSATVGAKLQYSVLIEVVNQILRPVVPLIDYSLTEIRKVVEAGVEEAEELVAMYTEWLAHLLSPYIGVLVRIMKQLGLAGRDMVENVRRIVQLMASHLRGISPPNRRLLRQLEDDLVAKIVDIVKQNWPQP